MFLYLAVLSAGITVLRIRGFSYLKVVVNPYFVTK